MVQRNDVQLFERVQHGYQLIDWVFIYYHLSLAEAAIKQGREKKLQKARITTIEGGGKRMLKKGCRHMDFPSGPPP